MTHKKVFFLINQAAGFYVVNKFFNKTPNQTILVSTAAKIIKTFDKKNRNQNFSVADGYFIKLVKTAVDLLIPPETFLLFFPFFSFFPLSTC